MSISNKLSYLKRKNGLTSEEIAHLSGVPLGTFNKIASGKTRSPSALTLNDICRALRVPIRYLLEEDIPEDCCLGMYSDAMGVTLVSEREQELMWKYQRLSDHGRDAVDALMDMLADQAPKEVSPEHPVVRLICYEPIAEGVRGCYGDGFHLKPLLASLNSVTSGANFAIHISGESMMPIHPPGTILAARIGKPTLNQLAVFIVNREGYVRKYCQKRGQTVLEAINPDLEDLVLTPQDEVHCLGVVLGTIRNYSWV